MRQTFGRVLNYIKLSNSAERDIERMSRELSLTKQRLDQTAKQLNQISRQLAAAEKRNELMVQQRREAMLKIRLELRDTAREYLLCKMPKQSVCAEIGVHEGEFSKRILSIVRPKRLHLIDPWEKDEGLFGDQAATEQATVDMRYAKVKNLFDKEIGTDRVRIHRNLSSEVFDEFEDSYFDWIYIDGNHLYEFVKQDLEHYYPKVKDGGYIAGDDYGNKGWWDNGIQRAVDEFLSKKSDLTLEVRGTQFILQKGGTEHTG
jgi:acetolactate synthase small subunit